MTDSGDEEGIPLHLLNEDYALALYLQTSDAFEDSFDPSDEVRAGFPPPEIPRFGGSGGGARVPSGGDGNGGGPASSGLSIIDPSWEVIDPSPDIHALFIQFNHRFFWGRLEGVEVKWSPRMTLCAGVCSYEGRGGLCSVRLSVPLLKLRPRKDLVETLLHEMIHAFLFVTANNRDRDGHGPEFQKHMNRINQETGTKISIYHSFHDEVDLYRQHWWRCDGVCRQRKPFFGYVKRSMNRAPGPNDNWWSQHSASCGGKFTKVKEPENYRQKNSAKDSSSSSSATRNNKLNSGASKGKGKGKGSSARNNNNSQGGDNNNANNGVDIRSLFSQQQQAQQQQQQSDQINSGALNPGLNGGGPDRDSTPHFPSLVDKENFKNAAFSGFGRTPFDSANVQVAPIESKPWLRRLDSLSASQPDSSSNSTDQKTLQRHQIVAAVTSATTTTTTLVPTTTTVSATMTSSNGTDKSTRAAFRDNHNDYDDDEDDLMDFMASVMDENNFNTLSSPPSSAPPPSASQKDGVTYEKTRRNEINVFGGGEGLGSAEVSMFGGERNLFGGGGCAPSHQRQDRTPPPPIPEAISIRDDDDDEDRETTPSHGTASSSSNPVGKPLFGTSRATRSAGPRISTPSSSRWDPAHDILSDSDSDEDKLFAKLDAGVERRRRGKRLKRSRSLDAKEGRRPDEGSRSRSPRARVTAPPSVSGAIPKKSWAAKKRDPALRAVPVRSRSVENSPKAKRSRTHSPSSAGAGGGSRSSRGGTGPRPSSSRDSSSAGASSFFGNFSARRSFDTDAIHTIGGARQKKRPFGGSAVSSFHHSLSTDPPDPFSASTSPRLPSAIGDASIPSGPAFFFGGGGGGPNGGLPTASNLPSTSRLSNSAPDVNNIASVHDHRSTGSSGRDVVPASSASTAAANLNGTFADDEEAALREAIRLSQMQIKDNQTPTPSDDDVDDDDDDEIAAKAAPPLPRSASGKSARHRIHSASASSSGGASGGGGRPFSWTSVGGNGPPGVASTSRGGSSMVQLGAGSAASTSSRAGNAASTPRGGSAASTSRAGSSMVQLPVFSPIGEAEFTREPKVPCPVCARQIEPSQINAHLDMCLK